MLYDQSCPEEISLGRLKCLLRHMSGLLIHFSLETPKRVISKQCRPRSDAIALNTGTSINHSDNKNLQLEMDLSKALVEESTQCKWVNRDQNEYNADLKMVAAS